jgi:NADH dehydrogenase (ubiquinone) Fe-S protein 2
MQIGTHALDIGALTPFFWLFEEREKIIGILRMHLKQRTVDIGIVSAEDALTVSVVSCCADLESSGT